MISKYTQTFLRRYIISMQGVVIPIFFYCLHQTWSTLVDFIS